MKPLCAFRYAYEPATHHHKIQKLLIRLPKTLTVRRNPLTYTVFTEFKHSQRGWALPTIGRQDAEAQCWLLVSLLAMAR